MLLKVHRKRIVVDQEKCIGCGLCISLAPGTFRLNSKGKSEVVEQKGSKPKDIKDAIDSCPVNAISKVTLPV